MSCQGFRGKAIGRVILKTVPTCLALKGYLAVSAGEAEAAGGGARSIALWYSVGYRNWWAIATLTGWADHSL